MKNRRNKEEEHYGNRQEERQTKRSNSEQPAETKKKKKMSWSFQELYSSLNRKKMRKSQQDKQENRIQLGEHIVTSCSSSPSN